MHRAAQSFVLLVAFALIALPALPAARESVGDAMARAQPESKRWHADAQLIQIDVTGFGFAIGPSGVPDMTRAGPPRLAMLTFASPAEPQTLLRVNVRINEPELPGPQQQARIAMGYKTLFTDRLPAATALSTRPVPPAVAGTLDRAITQAERDVKPECGRATSPMQHSCALIQQAELHAHRRDAADVTGLPLWTLTFGQHPRWADDVSRVVDPATGQVVARNVRSRFPTGVIPALAATVAGVRFFLGDGAAAPGRAIATDAPAAAARSYDDLFFYNAARDIQWELNLAHPAPRRRTSVTVQAVWTLPGIGNVFRETPRVLTVEPDSTASQLTGGANLQGTKRVVTANPLYESCVSNQRQEQQRRERQGQPPIPFTPCEPNRAVDVWIWSAGAYQVDFLVDGHRVAAGSFEMSRKEDIYGEIAARARDASPPSGEIRFLDAKVAALRFFEPDGSGRGQRRFSHRFPPSTRHVGWILELKHEPPQRWISLPLEALLFQADATGSRLVQRRLLHTAVPSESANTSHLDHFGWGNRYDWDRSGATTPSPGRWEPGAYRLDLFQAGRGRSAAKIASGTFEIR